MFLLGKAEARVLWYSTRQGQASIGHFVIHLCFWLETLSPRSRVKERGSARLGAPGHLLAVSRESCRVRDGHGLMGLSDPCVLPRRSELRPRMGTDKGSSAALCFPDQGLPPYTHTIYISSFPFYAHWAAASIKRTQVFPSHSDFHNFWSFLGPCLSFSLSN